MMIPPRAFLVLLGLACAAGAASASTEARLTLTGDGVALGLDIDTSTAAFAPAAFDIALAPGASIEETFDYTLQVTDDGRPATRDWSFCTPVLAADCGPAPTGRAQAYASIWLGRDPNSVDDASFWIDDTPLFVSRTSTTGAPGLYSGTLVYDATNTSLDRPQFATVTLIGAVFADVADAAGPVPEPAPAAAWLVGIAGLAAAAFSRSARATAAARR
jgi:hypothetical protein